MTAALDDAPMQPAESRPPNPMPVIHDCDNGLGLLASDVDDGLALLYLLARPEIDLRAVTMCFGNASLPRVDRITRKLLAYVGRPDLKSVRGASGPGTRDTPAARALVEMTAERPGEITIVATGPLTNIAAAASLDPAFFARVKRILCLGGCLFPAKLGRKPVNELNFGADPVAAATVLDATCPVVVFPATSCLDARFGWADLPRLHPLGGPVKRSVERWLHCCRIGRGIDHFVMWDLLPVVWLVHPELFDTQSAAVSLGPDAQLEPQIEAPGERLLVTGLRNPEALRAAFFGALGGFVSGRKRD